MQAVQESENDKAEIVIVCEPEGMSLQMGGLHPRASLYEKPVNLDSAKKAHAEFRRVMREKGVRVLTVREILAYGTEDHIGARVALEDFAMEVGPGQGGCLEWSRPAPEPQGRSSGCGFGTSIGAEGCLPCISCPWDPAPPSETKYDGLAFGSTNACNIRPPHAKVSKNM